MIAEYYVSELNGSNGEYFHSGSHESSAHAYMSVRAKSYCRVTQVDRNSKTLDGVYAATVSGIPRKIKENCL